MCCIWYQTKHVREMAMGRTYLIFHRSLYVLTFKGSDFPIVLIFFVFCYCFFCTTTGFFSGSVDVLELHIFSIETCVNIGGWNQKSLVNVVKHFNPVDVGCTTVPVELTCGKAGSNSTDFECFVIEVNGNFGYVLVHFEMSWFFVGIQRLRSLLKSRCRLPDVKP